ncbi:hypothetical protein [Undibacterium terreum]|uniref:Uncharacterized protein n=1 Tax=Undibacterium terreum TaxID=1224302 RepID=A0A916UAU9_9BURK|nr:hypothetical protein [Undibacterium terreum]GGC66695.1 hypothetical protein GCM10011396_12170 [Undibacterium terreum]
MNLNPGLDPAILSHDEYQAVADQLDKLWSRPTTAKDRMEIERLLQLIEPWDLDIPLIALTGQGNVVIH